MYTGCTHEEASFVSLDDLDNNDLEEKITYFFNEISIFIFKFEKNTTNHSLNILKTCTLIRGNFERFQVCFLV